MVKVIPPRLVEPYLTGQRLVIAGYVYRAGDCSFSTPSEYYQALALGYEGSEFSADMPELFVLRWIALDMSASLVPGPRPASGGPVSAVPEFFTLPVPAAQVWQSGVKDASAAVTCGPAEPSSSGNRGPASLRPATASP